MAMKEGDPKPGEVGHCGPPAGTPAEDITMTWPRCLECQAKEDELMSKYGDYLIPRTDYGVALTFPRERGVGE